MLNHPEKALSTALRRAGVGDATAALRILDELISHNPYNLDARARRAALRYHTKNYQGALDDAALLLQVRPDDDDALALAGDCHLRLGRRQDAVARYSRALATNPLNRDALAGLANIAESAGPPGANPLPPRSSDALPSNLAALLSPLGAAEETLLAYAVARAACPAAIIELGAVDTRLTIPLALALEHAGSGAVHSVGRYQTEFFGLESRHPFRGCTERACRAGIGARARSRPSHRLPWQFGRGVAHRRVFARRFATGDGSRTHRPAGWAGMGRARFGCPFHAPGNALFCIRGRTRPPRRRQRVHWRQTRPAALLGDASQGDAVPPGNYAGLGGGQAGRRAGSRGRGISGIAPPPAPPSFALN